MTKGAGGRLALLLVSLALSGAIAELVSRFYSERLSDSQHVYAPGLHRLFRPAAGVMPGVDGDSRFTTNEVGVRGTALPPRQQAYRILCVGASTTICTFLDDEETWPSLLMRRLNDGGRSPAVWIGNAGFSGYASAQHLAFVTRSALFDEMDCVIMLVGVNDLMRALAGSRQEAERPAELRAPFWRRSATLELVRRAWRESRRPAALAVEDQAGAVYRKRRLQRQAAVEVDALPDLTQELNDYEARLRAIVATLERRHLRLVLLSQPAVWSAELSARAKALLWMGETKDGRYLSPASLAACMARFNERLLRVCNETRTRCVDLSEMNGREELFYDDCHFNEAGAREVARLLGAQAGLIAPPASPDVP